MNFMNCSSDLLSDALSKDPDPDPDGLEPPPPPPPSCGDRLEAAVFPLNMCRLMLSVNELSSAPNSRLSSCLSRSA